MASEVNTLEPSRNLLGLRQFLHSQLTEDIMPFWIHHGVDEDGGINTCLRDDGSVVSRDKWLWSQWRCVWLFARLHNTVDAGGKWLDLARRTYDFAVRYGWDEDAEGWRLGLTYDGGVLKEYETIYVDAFAIDGLVELASVVGPDESETVLALARKTADHVLKKLELPHDQLPHYPYPVPRGARVQGIPMMFARSLWRLQKCLDEPRYRDAALRYTDEIFRDFYRPDRDLILERIAADGSEYPAPLGTAVVPGHVIEDMWFQIHILRDTGDKNRIEQACRIIRRHVELGWDEEHEGLFLAVDADGENEIGWELADRKLWWPHVEAMYALLLAREWTGEDWCLDWYDKVHAYAFSHFPVPEHGEWYRGLDRMGKPAQEYAALPVKDPFHLPRAFLLCIDVLDRLAGEK